MRHLIFDKSKILVIVLVMYLLVCDGKSLLSHVIGLIYESTWIAIVKEIFQHKLKYFGNICCLVFVNWVARCINSHGRPSPASKTWCHTSIKQHSSEDGDASCTAKVTDNHHKSVMNTASSPSPVFQPESDPTRHPSTSSASVDSLIDSSHQPLSDASRDTLGSSESSEETPPEVEVPMVIEREVASCVDVIDDEQKAVASPVRLTRTRIAIAAGVVGLGGYLCWRLLKK